MTENIPVRKWLKMIETEIKIPVLRHAFRKAGVEFIEIEAGQIKVKWVLGKQKPCFVKISRTPLQENIWQAVLQDMSKQAGCAAALAEGQWPRDAEALFKRQGAMIFPVSPDDFQTQCSADLDSSKTCRHILWAHLLFAERLEEDPRLIFDFLGKRHTAVLDFLKKFQVIKKANPLKDEIPEAPVDNGPSLTWQGTALWARSLPAEPSLWFEKMTVSSWQWKNKNFSEVLKEIAEKIRKEAEKKLEI